MNRRDHNERVTGIGGIFFKAPDHKKFGLELREALGSPHTPLR